MPKTGIFKENLWYNSFGKYFKISQIYTTKDTFFPDFSRFFGQKIDSIFQKKTLRSQKH